MAGPCIGGRRPISWRLAIVVAVVALFASNAWLKGIFGYGEIATDIPFLLFGVILFFTWRVNRNAANRQSELLGSARFGDRADVQKLEASGALLIGRSAKLGKLLRYDGAAHLLTMAPPARARASARSSPTCSCSIARSPASTPKARIRYYDQREFDGLFDPA